VCALAALLAAPTALAEEMDFTDALARVDEGLRTNPAGVPQPVLEACRNRRNFAIKQMAARQGSRAERSLRYCFDLLKISETGPRPSDPVVTKEETMEAIQARAAAEIERALELQPNLARGLEIYRDCAKCHAPEGWGLVGGYVPQIAGQHRTVIIKQLADIRAGNRDGVLMLPYASSEAIGGPQAVADVAGYIDSLEMSTANGQGDGKDLAYGKQLYAKNCARCHGNSGEGNAEAFIPRIQSQHFGYLRRQFTWIKEGRRRNANEEMRKQIEKFGERETVAVLDYVSRLTPPEELQAPPGWHNPDFTK